MNNSESIEYIEEFLKEGHARLTKKSNMYNILGDTALVFTILAPLLIFASMMIFTDTAILTIIMLALATIPLLIFTAFVIYFLSGVEPVFKEDVITESLNHYKGVENLRPSVIKGLNSDIINQKFEKYMFTKNLSLGEQEVFDQLSSENFQGTVKDLITVCKNINK